MKKSFQYIFVLTISLLSFSCSSDDNTREQKAVVKNTVIVYMLANNDLNGFVSDNLGKMSVNWSDEFDGHCVAIVDQPKNYDGNQVSLLEIQYGAQEKIKEYSNKDALDPSNMQALLADAMRLYPAEKYTLILWSHGLGWVPTHTDLGVMSRSLFPDIAVKSFGVSGGKQMELLELANGIPDHTFETIIFDACFMGSIEVAYELRNKSNYLIASPSEIIAEGFPYHITIPQIMRGATPESIAKSFVDYYDAKTGVFRTATIGVVKMDQLENLAAKTKAFYQKFSSASMLSSRTGDIQYFDRYTPRVFFDFKQMIDVLAEYGYTTEANELRDQLAKTAIYANQTDYIFTNHKINTNCGITSYVPLKSGVSTKLKNTYQTLSWYSASGASVLFE